ncbi:MAG: hypothetical protein HKO63_09010 [Acidimicrobiia bacterium]|nr:hypothetical protein [Acidimicrobiia bacterium]
MDLRILRMLALAWIPLVVVLVVVAAVIDASGGWPVLGSALTSLIGLVALTGIGWLRQRPIAPGDDTTYATTVLIKLALMGAAGLVGFALAISVGPWWLSVVGAALSLAGLRLAWPSPADQERHELLYLI